MIIVIFIIILAVLILVHELGHFSVAKFFGIKVEEFGLGLPPRAWGKKFGETLYSLNWLPIGGFVKIFGEDPVVETLVAPKAQEGRELHYGAGYEDDYSRAMFRKPKWIQALVLIAGISCNLLFAWLIISVGLMIGLPAPIGESPFGKVSNPQVVITSVLPNSPAAKAGLISGDTILSAQIGAQRIADLSAENISQKISGSAKGDVIISYSRGSVGPKTADLVPSEGLVKGERLIGVSLEDIGTLKLSFFPAILEGARSTYLLTISTAEGLANFIYQTAIFKSDLSQVTGPIGIAGVVGQASQLGFVYLLSLVALISINLALINLVPFPALDGGRLLFVAIEAIIRRPIPPVIFRWANGIGFALLILLMVVVTTHDIIKLF